MHAQVQGEVQMQKQEQVQVQAEVEVTVAEGEVVVAAGVGVAVVVGEVAAIEVAAAEEFVRDDAVVLAAGAEYMPMDTSTPSSREDTSPASHSHHRVLAEGRHYTTSAGAVAHADTAVVYTADIARGRGVGSSSRNALLIKAKSE